MWVPAALRQHLNVTLNYWLIRQVCNTAVSSSLALAWLQPCKEKCQVANLSAFSVQGGPQCRRHPGGGGRAPPPPGPPSQTSRWAAGWETLCRMNSTPT